MIGRDESDIKSSEKYSGGLTSAKSAGCSKTVADYLYDADGVPAVGDADYICGLNTKRSRIWNEHYAQAWISGLEWISRP